MAEGKLLEEKVMSKQLNEEVDVLIYLPKDYSPLYKYPIVIVQDGKDYIRFGKVTRYADELQQNGLMEKAIFALLPYQTVADRRRKYHPEGDQNEAYIRFLAHEFVPYLENRFSSFQMAGTRFLMGDSLGASLSLKAALKYPFTFGNVILHSPLITEDLLEMTEKADPSKFKLFHVIGSGETSVETTDGKQANFLAPNLAFHKITVQKGFEQQFYQFDGDHRWKFWQPYVKEALTYMLPANSFDLESMSV
ncbi:alpha/beta hydrolase [Listeria ilorinensis]|uniref:alpha/beta hydrolase n=1 Tax=Listeria ilorinensis TaxID=2867439 RepID=UPI001EF54FEA|nr:alpha/beta hydrolase-fold protein [Listeria ilorinensis]